MALFSHSGDRTEKATPRRRSEARKKGQIARSSLLAPAVVFLGVFVVLGMFAPSFIRDLSRMLQRGLSTAAASEITEETLQTIFMSYCRDISWLILVIAGAAFVLSIGANAAQGGLVFSGHRLGLHLENLNPAAGIRRLLPGTSMGELAKALLTVGVLSYLCWSAYAEARTEMPRYILMSPLQSSSKISAVVYRLAFKSGCVLVLIALGDYIWSRRRFDQSIRMTKQEIKEEARSAEGNPEVRSRIRKRQREIALRSMLADVKKADVVITNPTHYAVALQYVPQKMPAPTVVAKGKGFVALKIREIAQANKVPIVENKPLAQTLFKALDVGQQIPANLFKAIAEVLAYVYRLKRMRL
ncbi:MAG: flagellar biosynthesis protein FlhB [Acidobacteria bacterium]|nr:MAG: flagellar biosynthesis protein FlhB [Acidobacteriota bacterium]